MNHGVPQPSARASLGFSATFHRSSGNELPQSLDASAQAFPSFEDGDVLSDAVELVRGHEPGETGADNNHPRARSSGVDFESVRKRQLIDLPGPGLDKSAKEVRGRLRLQFHEILLDAQFPSLPVFRTPGFGNKSASATAFFASACAHR